MKKTLFVICLTIFSASLTAYKAAAFQVGAVNPPVSIQDPLLVKAWSLLYQRTDPVRLWDGQAVSGRSLAQFVVDHSVPILWDADNHCGGGSCSLRCEVSTCVRSDDMTSAHPIFLDPSLKFMKIGQMTALIDAMAHEIYHITLPYGAVDDTLYEEFSAYYVGENVSGNLRVKFGNYDALRPACLVKWFYDTQTLATYRHLHAYPQGILPSVKLSANTCPQPADLIETTSPASPLTCSLGADDNPDCVFPHEPTAAPESRFVCTQDANGLTSCETIYLKQPPSGQAASARP